MSGQNPDTAVEPAAAANPLNPKFVYLVGLLALIIIAALAGLTVQYRQRAISAELQLQQANEDLNRQNTMLDTFLNLKPGQQVQIVPNGGTDPADPE